MLNIQICLLSGLSSLFFYFLIFGELKNNTVNTFFNEHQLITVSNTISHINYHIVPYDEVRFTYSNGYTLQFAQYNTTLRNDTHITMYFTKQKEQDDLLCLNTFYLYLVCDPLHTYYPGTINHYDNCSYSLNIYTDAACQYIFAKRNEL
jgi:hypothetical protein